MFKVCIIGLGFVGNAMYDSFKLKNIDVTIYDKYKNGGIGHISSSLDSNIVFLALPTPFSAQTNTFDLSSIHDTCLYLYTNNYQGAVVIKSTLEPETISMLSNTYTNLNFIHNPEFLSSKTAFDDFHNQTHIVLGKSSSCSSNIFDLVYNFYLTYYPDAKISECDSLESECMKLFCNSFYAVKVHFFTELFLICQKNQCDYNKVKELMLKNNWINPNHTNVPGNDREISYGGMCFPKDTQALNEYMKKLNVPNQILDSCIKERNVIRNNNK